MYRFFLYLILTYFIYFILKLILKYVRLKNKPQNKETSTVKKPEQYIDKSKVVDAYFEEIK